MAGVYSVSVLAENGEGESESHPAGQYTIHSLSPPDPESLELVTWPDQDHHLLTNISWTSDLFSPDGGYNVTVTNPDLSTADGFPRLLDWSSRSLEVRLASSHPGATISIQTYEQGSSSSFSRPRELFRSIITSMFTY